MQKKTGTSWKTVGRMRGELCVWFVLGLHGAGVFAQSRGVDASLFSDLRWREIGPYRAGRTRALAGVPSEPYTFYLGAVNGGVWKTTDAGQTWKPIFDDQPTGSIGAVAVAPSDPRVVYVASGEGLARPDLSTGDGIYRSNDAGATWTHLGLREGQQIGALAVDATNPDRVFVAVTGHPYGPNKQRGVYRTLDGGRSFQQVLSLGDRTGASEVEIDPSDAKVVYAGMWQRQEGPWENGAFGGAGGGLFKSVDGGEHWNRIEGHGLPKEIVQVNLAIAPGRGQRVYAAVASLDAPVGIYRSDDGGASWVHAPADDPRPEARIGGGDLPVLKVDPRNPDTVYSASVVTWKSVDGGKTWTALRGSPGGDDYQNIYINPEHPEIVALASDQGVIVSLNDGASWSQWYNQGTAQMYHVTADNDFPYRVCGGQQDSGSACVASRSDDGRITFHDWHPVGLEEYGYAAPDPLDPDVVYGGKITRYSRRTGQVANVEPKPLRGYRVLRTEPLMFSPIDPHSLYFGANTLWLTHNGGQDWKEISPDLTRKSYDLPATLAEYKDVATAKPVQRGVIYALGLSPLDINRLWAGTDDGLIWTTKDGGKNWANVTPPAMQPFWKVFNMDAGHFDTGTAYAAVNTLRLDDMRPHLFRTHDGGANWAEIDHGLPEGAPTNTIREDPKRKGLLYAGTETQVYVSFDDGEDWQTLRLNMPATSVRDLQVKEDDLIAGTHGRGFLILDNVTVLRQVAQKIASQPMHLYQPQTALRIRGDMNPPTPWPPEMTAGKNPPDGAMIDYFVGPGLQGPIVLEVLDGKGAPVGRFSSDDPVPPLDPRYPDPVLWARPPRVLSATTGQHRFLWNMHLPAVAGVSTEPDEEQAVPHDTPDVATSPWVLPGKYTVRMTAGGKTQTAPLQVRMDPRVKTPNADLEAQFALSKTMYEETIRASGALHEATLLRQQMRESAGPAGTAAEVASEALRKKLDGIAGPVGGEARRGAAVSPPTLTSVRSQLLRLQHAVQSADVKPTTAQQEAYGSAAQPLAALLAQWQELKAKDLKAANALRQRDHLSLLQVEDLRGVGEWTDALTTADEN